MTLTAPKARCPRCGADPDDGALLEIAAARKRLIMENLDDEPGCLGAGVGFTQPDPAQTWQGMAFDNLLSQFESYAHTKGTLFERCQGKGWPEVEDRVFTNIRDKYLPALRARLRKLLAPSWVPVSERLPEKFTEVLICFRGAALPATGQYTGNLRDSADGWSYPSENGGDDTDWTVTHWQPLPEHPEAARLATKSQAPA